uniref:Uncharacterized protein n=1 Tax=Sphaerodactylus townsendi TaxID=933632 RepID=A0ACB8E7Z5_9SAUR
MPIQVKVKAVLKKREYGPKYMKNNFITGVRAINEFCLKSRGLLCGWRVDAASIKQSQVSITLPVLWKPLDSDLASGFNDGSWSSHYCLSRAAVCSFDLQSHNEPLGIGLLLCHATVPGCTRSASPNGSWRLQEKIRRRSPHDDTEAFTVFLRSDVEAKSLEVWGSLEALARERKRRKEAEIEYRENLFKNQKLLKEYKDFLGETKPRSNASAVFLRGPGKVVMVAICINGLNFFFKLLAWVYTGSASMFSEAIHSLADTCNQALLALGVSQSVKTPDPSHPYGFTNMRYIASLISGVGIFMMGAGLSWYHGVMGLLHPQPIESLLWAYCILAGSLVSEGATLLVAINEIRRSARAKGLSFYQYVIQARDPSTNVVLLEDTAAVLGVTLAATCMGLTSLTGNPYYDSLGSLGVGTLLGAVSAFLIYTNTEALLGRSIMPDQVQRLTELLESDPAVRAIHDVKATDMGMSQVRFKAEVDFDGRVVTRSYLEKQDIEQLLQEIQQVKTLEELEAFMLKHGENIIDTLGAEVDRLEKELKQRNPEVRHVDLEIL